MLPTTILLVHPSTPDMSYDCFSDSQSILTLSPPQFFLICSTGPPSALQYVILSPSASEYVLLISSDVPQSFSVHLDAQCMSYCLLSVYHTTSQSNPLPPSMSCYSFSLPLSLSRQLLVLAPAWGCQDTSWPPTVDALSLTI